MKVTMYGADICINCREAKDIFAAHPEIQVEYKNITETTATLKEFLSYRDYEKLFEPIKKAGKIGIPFFVLEDGRKTFDVMDIVEVSTTLESTIIKKQEIDKQDSDMEDISQSAKSCSINNRGQC